MLLTAATVATIATIVTAAPPSVSLSDPSAVKAAAASAAQDLAGYYVPNASGAIPDVNSDGVDSRQWYESGVMWGALMEYIAVSRDVSLAPTVAGALSNASYAASDVGSFLGPDRSVAAIFLGRWNDDIGWYGLAAVTAASAFGPTATLPGSSLTYLQVAAQTFSEIWEEWDPACGGGIFWSRDRYNPKTKNYKSTITNGQAIILAARLAILTGNTSYVDKANAVYSWLKTSGIINATNYFVYDGVDISQCQKDLRQYSYNPGTILGGLAWLYKATGNPQYIQEAGPLLTGTLSVFSQNGIISDICEGGSGICTTPQGAIANAPAINVAQYKGVLIRGLMYLNMLTNDASQKDEINAAISTSFQAMLETCDNNMDCNEIWAQPAQVAPNNFHAQLVATELFTAALQMVSNGSYSAGSSGSSASGNATPYLANPISNQPNSNPKAPSSASSFSISILFATTFSTISMLFFVA